MYALFTFAGTLGVWKINYCTSNYQNCARYERAQQAEPIPDNLLPNGKLLQKVRGKK
jgi:hypothetical protein